MNEMVDKIMILHELKLAGVDITRLLEKAYEKYGKERFEDAVKGCSCSIILK